MTKSQEARSWEVTVSDCGPLRSALTRAVGDGRLVDDPAQLTAYAVDGVVPGFLAIPADVAGVRAVMQVAASHGATVVPRGHGTKMRLGNPPRSADVLLCLQSLNRVVAYDVDNLTVIAQAGAVLEDLRKLVAGRHQMLPLDAPFPMDATVGGVVASNSSGPWRLGYGSARDLILGMRVVMPSGDLIHTGGATVKNVAGYDLDKLFIGSLGTLGAIVEVGFRLFPKPEATATLQAAFLSAEQALVVTGQLLQSQYLPVAVELLNPLALQLAGLGEKAFGLAIGLEGAPEAVQRQVEALTALCQSGGAPAWQVVTGQAEADLWSAVRGLPGLVAARSPAVASTKSAVPLSGVAAVCRAATAAASRRGLALVWDSRAGSGVVYAWFLGLAGDEPRQAAAIQELREAATAAGGTTVLGAGLPAVKRAVPVWGGLPADLAAMKAIKSALDPLGIMSPGRYVGGI